MDLIDQLQALSQRTSRNIAHIQTEQATKTALIMPFINALGYNVFDPTEVVPEYICDIGTKKGEKVDYAIFRDGKPIMLFECKHVGGELSRNNAGQLLRYFHVTEARIGVLTNGVVYKFFTDLDSSNKMDERPFLEFDLLNVDEGVVAELKKLTKSSFDIDQMLSTAHDLKYLKALRNYVNEQLSTPDPEFVKFLTRQVYQGSVTQKVTEQFTDLVRRSLNQLVTERVTGRLKTAMLEEQGSAPAQEAASGTEASPTSETAKSTVVTTEEEMEGFHIVRAILREIVPVSRIVYRDVQSYFGILLDDNNRKPIVRLHFNSANRRFLTLFDVAGGERMDIESVDDLYKVADRIKSAVLKYEGKE